MRASNPECQIPNPRGGTSANDARAREPIVQAAMIAAEERGEETEAGRHGEHQPDERADEGAAHIERLVAFRRVGRDDANARGHLAERLTSGGEGDEVTAILDEEEC